MGFNIEVFLLVVIAGLLLVISRTLTEIANKTKAVYDELVKIRSLKQDER